MTDPRLVAIQHKLSAGDVPGARILADALLGDARISPGDRLRGLLLRSRAFEALRDLRQAIADLDDALALDPAQSRVWNELGLLCADAGSGERAIAAFGRAAQTDPQFARAWNNLGNALRSAGRIDDAVRAAEHAVEADPIYTLAWANLGALKRDTGDDEGAERALRRALALDANQRSAQLTLAGLLRDRSDLGAAVQHFRRAAELDLRDANAIFQLAGTLAERDDVAGAHAAYAAAEVRDPRMLRALFGHALTLPMLARDRAAIDNARAGFVDGLATIEHEAPRRATGLTRERLQDELRWTNFLLAYQGGDDRPLQARYAQVVHGLVKVLAPEWLRPLPPRVRSGSRLKVGFVSEFFREGTAGRYFEHWITGLPREEFEVFAYHLLPGMDGLAQRLAAQTEHFRHCPWWRPSQLAPRIRADALDVLVYPELGMGAVAFALSALRLAPLQCAGWGHPVTTGQPMIDVFFSSAVMEPADAATHYSERLVTLPGIGTRYSMPAVPSDATRDRFGLPEGVPLLLCPQSLFKVHPDNDPLFARILDSVRGAVLVGFEGRDPALTARFRTRLADSGVAPDRLRLLPQCGHDDFLRINSVCDVMLDTLHWSGGNTSLDALACALPIVTLPGSFMRGRQSAGMLELMEITEGVARDVDDYVRVAAHLAADRTARDAMSSHIRESRARIFDDPAPVAALAAFLRKA